jgi:heme/copper-type cytochrome/quinol oxidase subunit 4
MGWVTAAVLPVTAVICVIVAVTDPFGTDSVVFIVVLLALAGVALTVAGFMYARSSRR